MEEPKYRYAREGKNELPPNYARVAESLSREELKEEIKLGKGDSEYIEALKQELLRRKRRNK